MTDPATVRALADRLGDAAIDVLFNVAGSYGGPGQSLGQMKDDLALGDVAGTFDINASGPLRMTLRGGQPSLGDIQRRDERRSRRQDVRASLVDGDACALGVTGEDLRQRKGPDGEQTQPAPVAAHGYIQQ